MRTGYLFIFLIIVLLLPLNVRAKRPDVLISFIEAKPMVTDWTGNRIFAVKARVQNLERDGKVTIILQALDGEGFELGTVTLSGYLEFGEEKELSGSGYVFGSCPRVEKWVVKDIFLSK